MQSFHTLFVGLSTVVLNEVSLGGSENAVLVTAPTPGQRKAFYFLGVNPARMFPEAGWNL